MNEVLDEEEQMAWLDVEAEAEGGCPHCASRENWSSEAWGEDEGDFEADEAFEAHGEFESAFALFEGGDFETAQTSTSLAQAIPDSADHQRHVPLDYRLNAKALVGKLPGDLERLKTPDADDVKDFAKKSVKFARSGGGGYSLGLKLLIATLKNIPAGYLAAGADIAEDWAARGYSRGVVIGADRKPKSYLFDLYDHEYIPDFKHAANGRKIAASNYGGGLLAGYLHGREMARNQNRWTIFWKDIGRRMGDQSYRGAMSTWGEKQWRTWYVEVAAAFRRYHL